MLQKVGTHFLVGVYNLVDQIRSGLLPVPKVRRGDQRLDVKLVGVEHQPYERLAVIGFGDTSGQAADVGQNDQPMLRLVTSNGWEDRGTQHGYDQQRKPMKVHGWPASCRAPAE